VAGDVKFAVVNASSVASGTQDFTSAGFGTPKGAIFFMNGVTADGIAAHSRIGIGAWDGSTANWATGVHDEDAVATTDTGQRSSVASNRVIWIPTNTDTTWAELDYSTTVTDGVRVSWITSPGAGYHISCLLIGGADASVDVGSFQANASTTPKTVTTGIDQKLVFLVGNNSVVEEVTAGGHHYTVWGWATENVTFGPGAFSRNGVGVGSSEGGFYNTHIGAFWVDNRYQLENFTTTSFDFTSKGSVHSGGYYFYVAVDTDTKTIFNDSADTPTSTGDWQRTGYGMTPDIIFGHMVGEATSAGVNTVGLHTTDLDGVACNSIFASDGTNEFCYGGSTEDAAATTNVQSVGTQSGVFLQYDDSAAVKHVEGTVSAFESDGVRFNLPTAAAARYANWFAIGSASVGGVTKHQKIGLSLDMNMGISP
jgi:hypothetical protein